MYVKTYLEYLKFYLKSWQFLIIFVQNSC